LEHELFADRTLGQKCNFHPSNPNSEHFAGERRNQLTSWGFARNEYGCSPFCSSFFFSCFFLSAIVRPLWDLAIDPLTEERDGAEASEVASSVDAAEDMDDLDLLCEKREISLVAAVTFS
jgi:hypothetical protein